MRILVTGGAGFVGTTLIPALLEKGHTVRTIDNLMYGGDPLLPFFRNPRFEFVKGDIRNPDEVKAAVAGQDAIIHLAAIVGYPACRKDPQLAKDVNLEGSRNLIQAASASSCDLCFHRQQHGRVDGICTEESPSTHSATMASPKPELKTCYGDWARNSVPFCNSLWRTSHASGPDDQ